MKKHKPHKLKRRRNAGPSAAPPRRHHLRLPHRGAPPEWRTTLAALAGGAGGAALGGLVVNQQILSPEAVGIGMMGVGGATAYFADGNTRVLGNSVAAAGAGQLALALMAKRAIRTERAPAHGAVTAPTPPAQLASAPPKPSDPARRSAPDGGVVVDLFRDTVREMDDLDDDTLPPRDAARPRAPVEPHVIDLYDDESDAA